MDTVRYDIIHWFALEIVWSPELQFMVGASTLTLTLTLTLTHLALKQTQAYWEHWMPVLFAPMMGMTCPDLPLIGLPVGGIALQAKYVQNQHFVTLQICSFSHFVDTKCNLGGITFPIQCLFCFLCTYWNYHDNIIFITKFAWLDTFFFFFFFFFYGKNFFFKKKGV